MAKKTVLFKLKKNSKNKIISNQYPGLKEKHSALELQ